MARGGKRIGAGRPKGSRGKKTNIFGQSVERICEVHNYHPTEFLIAVANGTDTSEEWTPAQRLQVNVELHKSIHNQKPVLGAIGGEILDGQFTLVFEEGQDDFTLPSQANAEGATEALREESL